MYLGAPISFKSLTSHNFESLLNKVSKKCAGWKGRLLSHGGKLTLIKSVLSSIPLYTLSILKPPQCVLNRLEKIFSLFFWDENNKIWIAWKKIAKPINEGGLGIRSLKEVMDALHAKLAWNIQTSASPFSEFMSAKYLRNPVVQGISKQYHSKLWKNICLRWNFVVENKGSNIDGSVIWKPNPLGFSTLKSAWNCARGSAALWSISTFIWKSYISTKLSVFFWKLWFGGVPTDDNIKRCLIPITSKCSCCFVPSEESADHLFGDSELAQGVWSYFSNIFGVLNLANLSWRDKCLKWWNVAKGVSQDKLIASFIPIIIVWEIWYMRNFIRHDEHKLNVNLVIAKSVHWIVEINGLLKPSKPLSFLGRRTLQCLPTPIIPVKINKPILVTWKHPAGNVLKLNIDGSSRGATGEVGCGGVIRDFKSKVIGAFSIHLGQGSNNYAEFSALKFGLLLCYQLSIAYIQIETDSLLLANCCNNKCTIPWTLFNI